MYLEFNEQGALSFRLPEVRRTITLVLIILKQRGRKSKEVFLFLLGLLQGFYSAPCQMRTRLTIKIKISELETQQLSMLKVAKQQMIVVCTTSETVKSTLANVAANEMQLSKNLNVMQKKTNENGEKTNQASPQATF